MDKSLKVLQINLGRSLAASINLSVVARDQGADVALVQEPYLFEGKPAGITSAKVFFLSHTTCRTAIVVFRRNLSANLVESLSSGDHTVVEFPGLSLFLASVYIPCVDPTSTGRRISPASSSACVKRIFGSMRKLRVVAGGDFNCRDPAWGDWRSSANAQGVKEIILNDPWHLLNSAASPATFSTFRGSSFRESWIDLTLCSKHLSNCVDSWRVDEDTESASDHRFISFVVRRSPNVNSRDPSPLGSTFRYRSYTLTSDTARISDFVDSLGYELSRVNTRQGLDSFCSTLAQRLAFTLLVPPESLAERSDPLSWFDSELRELSAYLRKWRKMKRRGLLPSAWLDHYWEEVIRYRKLMVSKREAAWRHALGNLDDKGLWSLIRGLSSSGKRNAADLIAGKGQSSSGQRFTENEILTHFFSNITSAPVSPPLNSPSRQVDTDRRPAGEVRNQKIGTDGEHGEQQTH